MKRQKPPTEKSKKYHGQFYKKSWIDRKISKVIRYQIDKRFYLFRKVLSEAAIDECMLEKFPRGNNFFQLEPGRKWTQNGCTAFQNILRQQWVYSTDKAYEGDEEGDDDKQKMQFKSFYLKVAEKLRISIPTLSVDNAIMHEKSLEVKWFW